MHFELRLSCHQWRIFTTRKGHCILSQPVYGRNSCIQNKILIQEEHFIK